MTYRLVACSDPGCDLIHGISVDRTSRPTRGTPAALGDGGRGDTPASPETPVRRLSGSDGPTPRTVRPPSPALAYQRAAPLSPSEGGASTPALPVRPSAMGTSARGTRAHRGGLTTSRGPGL